MIRTLGFIGAGNMAEAIVRAAIEADVVQPGDVVAADPSEARRAAFADLGVDIVADNAEVIAQSQQIVLAVKPQMVAEPAGDLAKHLTDDQVLITIMAGIRTAALEQAIGREARIVRVMPNTPMMIGRGMAGIALGAHASDGDDDLAMRLFSSGHSAAIRVDEEQLDAITAVSGSGPAYLFYLAEAMEQAATELGLDEHARQLVGQTLLGAAELLCRSPDAAAELRRKVTSPGGTTEAAIKHLDSQEVRQHIVDALAAAEVRSRELGG